MNISKNIKKALKRTVILSFPIASIADSMLTSCEDMMTVDTGDKAYVNAQDTLYSYLGIMRSMQDVAERQVILGEIRGDLVSSTEYTTDTLYAISNFEDAQDLSCSMLNVSDYYNIINNCNFYIHNADTSAIKSNVKYMVPEYAQVKAIRAWAYLQLVKNYGEVPYITEPVNSLSVIENFDHVNNVVNKDNLIDKLKEDKLPSFVNTNYPQYGSGNTQYGSWNNGFTSINAHNCFIPIRLVIADAYLLRGASNDDYVNAAHYYYDFLKNETMPLPIQACAVSETRGIKMYANVQSTGAGSFGAFATSYNYSENLETITVIPGSANAGIGKMLTRVADIYGYTPSSSQSSSENQTTDKDGNVSGTGEYTASGNISVTRNWKRQYAPSGAYSAVNDAQVYVSYNPDNLAMQSIEGADGRYNYSVENYTYEGDAFPLCSKASRGNSFYYTIPIYRKTLVWLRLAEAINRAGFPEYAFAILKDGINQYTLPFVGDRYQPRYNEEGYRELVSVEDENLIIFKDEQAEKATYYWYDENGEFVKYPKTIVANTVGNIGTTDSKIKWVYTQDTIPNDSIHRAASYSPIYYVNDMELIEKFSSFLDFSDEVWNGTYGIHARGCGFSMTNTGTNPILWPTDENRRGEQTTSIGGYRDSVFYDYSKMLKAQGVDIETASRNDIINAVENIIVDELALETAFEGNRFTDLIRIAEHKETSGYQGVEWLAKKIANRNVRPESINGVASGEFNNELYAKLKNKSNWFFRLPEWK